VTEHNNIVRFPSKNTPEPELPAELTIEETAPQFLSAEEDSEIEMVVLSCGHSDVFLTADGAVGCSECHIIVERVSWITLAYEGGKIT
jgi:hypothetical protein|tara:strand:- start:25 stop:288 length:264 start_codon:yes stop_codon:yes gene_type:complete